MTQLATAQYIRDNQENELWYDVCHEILPYAKLKEEWGQGHSKIIRFRRYIDGEFRTIDRAPVTQIYGYYVDDSNVKRVSHLGRSLENALRNVRGQEEDEDETQYIEEWSLGCYDM